MGPYTPIILLSLLVFCLLAFVLLAPVYRFLRREEEASKQWTKEALAERYRDEPPEN